MRPRGRSHFTPLRPYHLTMRQKDMWTASSRSLFMYIYIYILYFLNCNYFILGQIGVYFVFEIINRSGVRLV